MIDLYQSGIEISEIAEVLGTNRNAVNASLHYHGVHRRRPQRCPMLPGELDRAAAMYAAGQSSLKIGRVLGFHPSTVLRQLHGSGVATRLRMEIVGKYTLDEAAFDRPSPERNDWVGFINGDGCLVGPRRRPTDTPRVSVGLAARDASHLDKLNTFLGSNRPVRRQFANGGMGIGRTEKAYIAYPSRRLYDSLRAIGLDERKSGRERVPVGLEDDPDFWRGMVDADGWLITGPRRKGTSQWYAIGLCGSREVCEGFAAMVARRAGGDRPNVGPNGSILKVQISGIRALHVIGLLYTGACCALDRKAKLASQFLKARADWVARRRLAAVSGG